MFFLHLYLRTSEGDLARLLYWSERLGSVKLLHSLLAGTRLSAGMSTSRLAHNHSLGEQTGKSIPTGKEGVERKFIFPHRLGILISRFFGTMAIR